MLVKKRLLILLFFYCPLMVQAQVTFIIKSLPGSVPKTDTIFISGTFNNWNVKDLKYMLHQQSDGTLSVTLPIERGKIEYKFTRGSWIKVETDTQNNYIENRVAYISGKEIIEITIENWLDIGGVQAFPYHVFFYFSAVLSGLFLFISSFRIRKKSKIKFQSFIIFNSFLILFFSGIVVYYLTGLIWQIFFRDLLLIALFSWGPCLFIFVNGIEKNRLPGRIYRQFLPAICITLLLIFKYFDHQAFSTIQPASNPVFSFDEIILYGMGVVLNAIYFFKLILSLKHCWNFEWPGSPANRFARLFSAYHTLIFLMVVVNFLFILFSVENGLPLSAKNMFIIISGLIFIEVYFIWRHPEILTDTSKVYPSAGELRLKERIHQFMLKNKPFKDPDLNIRSLAGLLDMQPYALSKVLNECFDKSFRDYVNHYRVEEFIQLAREEKFENYTFLALAHEVGFNSKSTFNLAFKKATQRSPREFFKETSYESFELISH